MESHDINLPQSQPRLPKPENRQASDAVLRLKSLCLSTPKDKVVPIIPVYRSSAEHQRLLALNQRKKEEIHASNAEIQELKENIKCALEEKDELLSDAIGLADENEDLAFQLGEKTAECENLHNRIKALEIKLNECYKEVEKAPKKEEPPAELWQVSDYELAIGAMKKEMQRKVREVEADKSEAEKMMKNYQDEAHSAQEMAFKALQENKLLKRLVQCCPSCRTKLDQQSGKANPRRRCTSIISSELQKGIQGITKRRAGGEDIRQTEKQSSRERSSSDHKTDGPQGEGRSSPRKRRLRLKVTQEFDSLEPINFASPLETIRSGFSKKTNPAHEDGDLSRTESTSCATPSSAITQTETACTDHDKHVEVRLKEKSHNVYTAPKSSGWNDDDWLSRIDALEGNTFSQSSEEANCNTSSEGGHTFPPKLGFDRQNARYSSNPLALATHKVGKRVSRSRFAQYRAGKSFPLI